MKKLMMILMVLIVVCAATVTAYADVHVRGYYRSNGTYVQPHYRSNPDGNFYNNWSTYPNVNPYTGDRHKTNTKLQLGKFKPVGWFLHDDAEIFFTRLVTPYRQPSILLRANRGC